MESLLRFFKTYAPILIIISLGIAIYTNGIFNDFVNDDIAQITENSIVQSTHNIPQFFFGNIFYNDGNPQLGPAYYKPLMFTSFSIIYSLFGANAVPFHIFQILIFIANACLLFIFLKQFFKNATALVLSLIFLVHPINSEVALYISDLQDALFFFFGITALLILQKYAGKKSLFISGMLIFLSLLSKETGLLYLLISLLYVFLYRRKHFVYYLITTASFFGLYVVCRIHAIGLFMPHLNSSPIETLTFQGRLLSMPAIFFFYLKQMFFPLTLSVSYLWVVKQIDIPHFILPLVTDSVFVVVIGCGLMILKNKYTVKKKHSANENYFYTYLFFMCWLLLGLVFHLQLITLDKTVADRWLYFPLVGLLGMIGVILEIAKINWKNILILLCIVLIIILLSARSFRRTFDFRNDLTLSLHDIKVADDYELEEELCYDYFKLGRYDLVKLHAERSIRLFHFVLNHTDLGVAYAFMHNYKDAKKAYLTGLKYGDYDSTYNDLSALALYYGNPKKNISIIKHMYIKKFPHSALLWLNLARLEYVNGDTKSAKKDIAEAYHLAPTDPAFEFYYMRITENKSLTTR